MALWSFAIDGAAAWEEMPLAWDAKCDISLTRTENTWL